MAWLPAPHCHPALVPQQRIVAGFPRNVGVGHILPPLQPNRLIACQANPRRVARVTKLIEREIGSMMLTDKVLMDVTKTKQTPGDDRGILCSCSGVHVTSDLQVVKVYVSVFTEDEKARERTLSRLQGLSGYVRRLIGQRVRLRLTPEIRFIHDVAVERGERVLSLLDNIKDGKPAASAPPSDELPVVTDAASQPQASARKQRNPFWEGVGESDFDSDGEDAQPQSFFSADMFPDATLAEEELADARKREAFKMRKGSPRFRKSRKGKIVRK